MTHAASMNASPSAANVPQPTAIRKSASVLIMAVLLLAGAYQAALAGTWTQRDNADGPAHATMASWSSDGTNLYLHTIDANTDVYTTSGGAWSTIARPGSSRVFDVYFDGTNLISTGADSATGEVASFWYSTLPVSAWTGPRTLAANGRIRGALKLGASWYFMTVSDAFNVARLLTTAALTSNPSSHSDVSTNANVYTTSSEFVAVATNFNLAITGHLTDGTIEFRGYNDSAAALWATRASTGVSGNNFVYAFDCGSQAVVVVNNGTDSAILLVDSDGDFTTQTAAATVLVGGVEFDGGCVVPTNAGAVWRLASGTFANVAAYELTGESGTTQSLYSIDGSDLFASTTGGELWEYGAAAPTAAFSCTPTAGTTAQKVVCTDSSTLNGELAEYSWSGDCGTSSSQNPVLDCPLGANDITLTVQTIGGTDAEAKTDYVTLTACPDCPACPAKSGAAPGAFSPFGCED